MGANTATFLLRKKALTMSYTHNVVLINAILVSKQNCTEGTKKVNSSFGILLKCILWTYLIPGTLGTSQHDLGRPSEDALNCFLLGSMSPNPIPNNCPSVTETQIKSICKYKVTQCSFIGMHLVLLQMLPPPICVWMKANLSTTQRRHTWALN